MESIDDDIFNNRDKTAYRYKEKISRYKSKTTFLLDEALDIELLGKSTLKQAVNLVIEAEAESFRDVVSKMII